MSRRTYRVEGMDPVLRARAARLWMLLRQHIGGTQYVPLLDMLLSSGSVEGPYRPPRPFRLSRWRLLMLAIFPRRR